MRALAFQRWAARQGLTGADAAARLGLSDRTLQYWEAAWRRGRMRPYARGRPAPRSDRATRQRLLALIELVGPQIGVPTLQSLFRSMPRREIADMLRRYRRIWRRRGRRLLHILHWRRAGTVWAIDFAEPPLAVEGAFDRLLAVRDLASGMQLLWLPVTDETARTAMAGLESLFREHGPPLVLKSDNGSAFIADAFARIPDAVARLPSSFAAGVSRVQRGLRGGHRLDEDPDASPGGQAGHARGVDLRRYRGGPNAGQSDREALGPARADTRAGMGAPSADQRQGAGCFRGHGPAVG